MRATFKMDDGVVVPVEPTPGHRLVLLASDIVQPGTAEALAALNHLVGTSSIKDQELLRNWLPRAYGIAHPLGWWMDRSVCVASLRSRLQAISEVVDCETLSRWIGISEPLIERFIRGAGLDPPSWARARIWLLSTGPGTDLSVALHVMRALYPGADPELFASVGHATMEYLEAMCSSLRVPAPEWIALARSLPAFAPADRGACIAFTTLFSNPAPDTSPKCLQA